MQENTGEDEGSCSWVQENKGEDEGLAIKKQNHGKTIFDPLALRMSKALAAWRLQTDTREVIQA